MKISKLIASAALSATIILASSCTTKTETTRPERTVSVQGIGTIELNPDCVFLVFSVSSESWDVNIASSESARKMTAVQEALKAKEITEDRYYTYDYSIRQAYTTDRRRYRNYIVTNKINVTINNIEQAGAIIDSAIAAGANELTSLEYSVTADTSEAIKKARMIAVKDAEEKAQILAGATGAKVGQIMTITESTSTEHNNYVPMAASNALEKREITTPLSAGTKSISIIVNSTYELE